MFALFAVTLTFGEVYVIATRESEAGEIYSQIGTCNNVDVKEFINQLSADIGKIYEEVKKKKIGKELKFIGESIWLFQIIPR